MKNKSLISNISIVLVLILALSACTQPSGSKDKPGSFNYNNHSYKIVKTASSWFDAKNAAIAAGGYLVNISDSAENAKIYSELNKYIAASEYSKSVAVNGGGATYVWLGANDIKTEGTWKWTDNKVEFWKGGRAGSVVDGQYNNWGKNRNGQQKEPDNAGNKQDAAGIALTPWPKSGSLGQKSQWNDVNITNKLFYVIEFNQIQE